MRVELNGREPGIAELHRLVELNYGHYTAFQVRDGGVRGLALHLARLADGAEELFGHRIGVEEEHRLLGLVRHALGRVRDASVRVTFVPGPGGDGPPDVLVSVADPVPDPPGPPLRIQTVTYERDLPEHKHRGTFMLDHHVREARLAGFDDRLFVGRDGRIREGTAWNLAVWDGDQVLWPQAPVLRGVTMVLLQIAMTMNGAPWGLRPVSAADLTAFPGAAAVSADGVRGIASLDEVPCTDNRLVKMLAETWAEVPLDEL